VSGFSRTILVRLKADATEMPDDPIRIPIEAEIDLHAFAPRDIPSVVEEYVNEAAAAGFKEVRLVHGRGRGVQRGIVQATLERHPLVVEFRDDTASHLGATIARLR
jgi:dsDNA-specific endonuclease/ATPase MutS2